MFDGGRDGAATPPKAGAAVLKARHDGADSSSVVAAAAANSSSSVAKFDAKCRNNAVDDADVDILISWRFRGFGM